jgi:hypothetical protein
MARPARIALLITILAALAVPGMALANLSFAGPTALDHDGNNSINGIACPSASVCTVVDGTEQFSFDPATGAAISSSAMDAKRVACASASQCTAYGTDDETTFDPSAPGNPVSVKIDSLFLLGLACPSIDQCTAMGDSGEVATFDPRHPLPQSGGSIAGAGGEPAGLTCPSTTECVTLGSSDEVTFNPASPAAASSHSISGSPATDVACASPTQCTAIQNEQEITFDPSTGDVVKTATVSTSALAWIACPSTQECVALDNAPSGTYHAYAFNPLSPGTPTPDPVGSRTPAGDTVFACAENTQCTFGDNQGYEHTFTPGSSATPKSAHIADAIQLDAVACSSTTQCSAVDHAGQATTFAPGSPGTPRLLLTGFEPFQSISCPSASQCTATSSFASFTSPSDQQAATFDPQSSAAPKLTQIGLEAVSLAGVACPLVSQCSVPTGLAGGAASQPGTFGEATFDPQTATSATAAPIGPQRSDDGSGWYAISCPSQAQCTIGGTNGTDGELATFKPQSPGSPTSTPIAGIGAITALACPSTSQCTAVYGTDELTFNPTSIGSPKLVPIAMAVDDSVTAIACPSASFCVAVDDQGDAIQGDPQTGSWASARVSGAAPLTGVACPSTTTCVLVDQDGNGFSSASRPIDSTPPKISSTAFRVGTKLSASTGVWSGAAPIHYAFVWMRCHKTCTNIAGATHSTYTPVRADAGARLDVAVIAANSAGQGTAVAPQTAAPIAGLPSGSAKLTGLAAGHPKLGFGLAAGLDAPALRKLVVALPKGVTLRGSALRRALKITAPGTKKEKFKSKARGSTLTITLSKPGRKVRLSLSDKALAVSKGLAKAIRKHKTKHVTVTARATDASGFTAKLSFGVKA